MELEALLLALKSYQTYNPSGWVGIYRVLPMWAGIASCVLGLLLLLFGGGRVLFRIVAGPIGAVLGYVWTPVLIAKFGLTGVDPRLPSMAAAVLLVLGFLFPPAITFLGVGLPLGLVAGQIAGTTDFLLGFVPAFIIGGLVAAILHHIVSSVVSSAAGAWLLVIGALAALHQFGGLVTAVANQPWGVIIAAALFAVAGSVYQIAMRPSPEEQEKLRAERAQQKQRQAERRALEKRWGVK
jgi:large-conductance mechanosensitive channel